MFAAVISFRKMYYIPYRLIALQRLTAQRREVSDNCKSVLRIPGTKSAR
jgi:hypothetical protein